MRIGINFHSFDGFISGVEYYCLGLIRSLLEFDRDNDYVVFTNAGELLRRYVGLHENLKVIELRHIKTRPARIFWEHTRLAKAADREQLDVLHCPSYICPIRRSSARYVVTVHDTIAIDHPHWAKPSNALYFGLFMKKSLGNSCRIIAVSKATAQLLAWNFATAEQKIRIIYPGIDAIFNTNRDRSRAQQVRRRYKLPERYILYVGNIEPKKNLGVILSAQKAIGKKGLPQKLVIVGKRSWCSKLELDAIGKGVAAGKVILAGYVDRMDLPVVYQMADVFVFPSLYEGFGFPPLEAMACGVPVVASDSGALAETLADAAVLTKPSDTAGIAEAIVRLVRDTRFRDIYVRRGLSRCRKFSWQETVRQSLAVYEEAAGSGKRLT